VVPVRDGITAAAANPEILPLDFLLGDESVRDENIFQHVHGSLSGPWCEAREVGQPTPKASVLAIRVGFQDGQEGVNRAAAWSGGAIVGGISAGGRHMRCVKTSRVLDLVGWNCVLCDCPCTFPLPRILVWGTPAHPRSSPA
jgi:hypothetical protein